MTIGERSERVKSPGTNSSSSSSSSSSSGSSSSSSSSRTDRWVHFQQNAGLRLYVQT